MKKYFYSIFGLVFLFSNNIFGNSSLMSNDQYPPPQDTCEYLLELYDSFGDGWNGSILTVTVNGISTPYTIEYGYFASFYFEVYNELPVVLDYSSGNFEEEVTYFLYDPDGIELLSNGPNPPIGEVYNANASCPACPVPSEITFSNITFSTVQVNFNEDDYFFENFIIEYGLQGFSPGAGTIVEPAENFVIEGLSENTIYDFYIQGNCGEDGLSNTIGPFTFQTAFEIEPAYCFYTLELNEMYGGDWYQTYVTVTINNFEQTQYTIEDYTGFASFEIGVISGYPISIAVESAGYTGSYSYSLFDTDGIEIFSDGPDLQIGEVYNEIALCPLCPLPTGLNVTDVLFSSAQVNWNDAGIYQNYIVEYGVQGFPQGSGTTITTSDNSLLITGLNENTIYDVYLQAECGVDTLSNIAGPIFFQTEFIEEPSICSYSIEMIDSYGDGWNGGFLTITVNDFITYEFTMESGNYEIATFDVYDGYPITVEFTAGSFLYEISYVLYDSDGIEIFSDGQPPQEGIVFTTTADCPPCPAPNPSGVVFENLTSSSVDVNWSSSADLFNLEYGTAGFPFGQGINFAISGTSSTTLTGLNQGVTYDVYINADCGEDGTSSFIGPYSFTTLFDAGAEGDTCYYTLELFSLDFGWNGAYLAVEVNGSSTFYTIDVGQTATFEVPAIGNLPIIVSYVPGFFEFGNYFNILDPAGNILVAEPGPLPAEGIVLNTIACPSCPGPVNAEVFDINATNVIVNWASSEPDETFVIEYGSIGFTLGEGISTEITGNTATIQGLEEGTYYNFYVYRSCEEENSIPYGPFTFQTLWLNDVGIIGIINPDEDDCFTGNDIVTIAINNFGQMPQTLFSYMYSVNGEVAPIPIPEDGFFTGVIGNDSVQIIQFETTYDFSLPGTYTIQAWTSMDNDNHPSNDTITYVFENNIAQAPFDVDFESNIFPEKWSSDEFSLVYPPLDHNNSTHVVSDILSETDQTFEIITQKYGPLTENNTFSFDYRFVDWAYGTIGTILSDNDKLELLISIDCGENYDTLFTVNSSNHTSTTEMTTVDVDISTYSGNVVVFKFITTWGAGNYWIDLDNINLHGCPVTLGITADITDASGLNVSDGSISLSLNYGTPPYSYNWSTGSDSNEITGQISGTYFVTVTDINGCSEEAEFTINHPTSIIERTSDIKNILLAPNPTTGLTLLNIEFFDVEEINVALINLVGKVLNVETEKTSHYTKQFDLSKYSDGIYFIRISIENKIYTEKIVLIK